MVIELRNYLLKQGVRDQFIDYFKKHFIGSQVAMGAAIPALFTIKEAADRFCWIRQFAGMEERGVFLPSFYGGDVWNEFGSRANEMMLEWHDVNLLKPEGSHEPLFAGKNGIWVIDFYTTRKGNLAGLIELFNNTYIPQFKKSGTSNISLWISELAPNDFPRLPVYQEKDLVVMMTNFDSEEQKISASARLEKDRGLLHAIDNLTNSKKSLELFPVMA